MKQKNLTIDQITQVREAKKGLSDTVKWCLVALNMNTKDYVLPRKALRGIETLSSEETVWLNQQKWSPKEKTFILYDTDRKRTKKYRNVPLKEITLSTCLASVAMAAQYKECHQLLTIFSLLTAVTALPAMMDSIRDHVCDKLTQKWLRNLTKKNHHIQAGIDHLKLRSTKR